MKHRLSLVAILLIVFEVSLNAQDYDFSAEAPSGQTLYYHIIDDGHVAVVRPGIGDSYNNYVTGDLVIPASVEYENVTHIVSSLSPIGDYFNAYGSFEGCDELTSVSIPNSVTSIGHDAFSYCSGLTGALTIPNSVTSIENGAFYECSGLTGPLTIPNSVTTIGNYAFYRCSGLTGPLTIPNSVTSIGGEAFGDCSGLTGALTIPNSVTSIGNWAFSGCSGLTTIVVENGNSVYDSRENCNAIIESATNKLILGCMNTTIPNSVTSIGGGAFYD